MKRLLTLVLLFLPMALRAQTLDNTAQRYSVQYVKDHLFLQNGEDFNVVDIDLEWPEILGYSFSKATVLQQYIIEKLFEYNTSHLDSAYQAYQNSLGQPVKAPLKSIPDDKHFCYITANAHIKSYDSGHWICYKLTFKAEPESLSAVKPRALTQYCIYDIERQKVFTTNEFIRQSVTNSGEAPQEFYAQLFAPLADDDYMELTGAAIDGIWLLQQGRNVGFHVTCMTQTETLNYDTAMPYDLVRSIISKDGRKLIEKPLPPGSPQFTVLPTTWKGDTIYKNVDEMPEFKGGTAALSQYIANFPRPKNPVTGKLLVSFVIDKQGESHNVRVVSPLTPECDRHAVNLVKGMPKFTPGCLKGQPECVRMFLPISYQENITHDRNSE